MTEPTDNELMLLVKAGDLDKMSSLFKRYAPQLYGFLFHMTQDKQVSEDLVQDVFYRLLKYRNSFRGDGPFITWMFHVARNELKTRMSQLSKTKISPGLEHLPDRPNNDQLPDEQFRKKQEQWQLYQMMNQLRHEDKELLTLSKLQGLKYAQIAMVLDISETAVKVRVHRAFNDLKSIYKKTERHEM